MQVELDISRDTRAPSGGGAVIRPTLPVRWVGGVGRRAEGLARHAGQITGILWGTVTALFRGQVSLRQVLREMYSMGVQSVPIVLVTGIRAVCGGGLALTFSRSYHGPAARPMGVTFVLVASGLLAWLLIDPRVASMLSGRGFQ